MASDLVFGLELEMVFGFHESILRQHLDKHPATSCLQIVKQPGEVKRKSQSTGPYHGRRYQAWGLYDPTAEPQDIAWGTALTDAADASIVKPFRAYLTEPLEMIQSVLQTIPTLEGTRTYAELGAKQMDFSQWTVVRDASIDSLTRSDLEGAFRDNSNPSRDLKAWDSYGIELVSPPYADPSAARKDVADVVTALRCNSPDRHSAIATDQTGLHIHIGQRNSRPFALSTLQHLAYLLVVYEAELDLLLPIHRRSTASNPEIASNRETFFVECPEPVLRTVKDSHGVLVSREMTPLYESLQDIEATIFAHSDEESNGRAALVQTMGSSKAHLVNFSYCNRDPEVEGPATIEFRAHAGSLDADEVGHWIAHCSALVRLAERYANSGAQCKVQDWEDEISLEGLWAEMQLPEDTRVFYRRQVTENRARWPDWSPAPMWEDFESFSDQDEVEEPCEATSQQAEASGSAEAALRWASSVPVTMCETFAASGSDTDCDIEAEMAMLVITR